MVLSRWVVVVVVVSVVCPTGDGGGRWGSLCNCEWGVVWAGERVMTNLLPAGRRRWCWCEQHNGDDDGSGTTGKGKTGDEKNDEKHTVHDDDTCRVGQLGGELSV
nr:hypothetical protein BaRGS_031719 [Batillaria attramentaria]